MANIVNPTAAANAYSSMAKTAAMTRPEQAAVTETSSAAGTSFGNLLENSIRSSISTLKEGERASAGGISGTIDPLAVTQAVTAARLTLDTFLAVRDAAVSAYDKIQSTQM